MLEPTEVLPAAGMTYDALCARVPLRPIRDPARYAAAFRLLNAVAAHLLAHPDPADGAADYQYVLSQLVREYQRFLWARVRDADAPTDALVLATWLELHDDPDGEATARQAGLAAAALRAARDGKRSLTRFEAACLSACDRRLAEGLAASAGHVAGRFAVAKAQGAVNVTDLRDGRSVTLHLEHAGRLVPVGGGFADPYWCPNFPAVLQAFLNTGAADGPPWNEALERLFPGAKG